MKGIIAKDIYENFFIRKRFASFLFNYVIVILINYFAKTIYGFIINAAILIPFIIIPSLIQASSGYDEKYSYEKLEITTPITRKDIIKAKYLLSLLFFLINIIILFLLLLTKMKTVSLEEIIFLVTSCIILSSISLMFNLPISILFGKYGFVSLSILAGSGLLLYVILPIQGVMDFIVKIIDGDVKIISIAILIISIFLLLVSYMVSQYFYQKKEFD